MPLYLFAYSSTGYETLTFCPPPSQQIYSLERPFRMYLTSQVMPHEYYAMENSESGELYDGNETPTRTKLNCTF